MPQPRQHAANVPIAAFAELDLQNAVFAPATKNLNSARLRLGLREPHAFLELLDCGSGNTACHRRLIGFLDINGSFRQDSRENILLNTHFFGIIF